MPVIISPEFSNSFAQYRPPVQTVIRLISLCSKSEKMSDQYSEILLPVKPLVRYQGQNFENPITRNMPVKSITNVNIPEVSESRMSIFLATESASKTILYHQYDIGNANIPLK